MIPALINFLDENKNFINEFTPTQTWFIRLEDKLKTSYPILYRNFFAELSFDILALSEPEMAVIPYNDDHRYSIGIKFFNGNCLVYSIFSVVLQRGDISFEELKEQIKEKVKGTLFGFDKSEEIICDLIDNITEDRMVEI